MTLDAIVVGGGPNGLAAAIELAGAGRSVRLYEAADEVGGGTRSAELTLPGFVHDPCASVHPLALGSPFFRSLDLARHGLAWVQPAAPVAHALARGRSLVLPRALEDPLLDATLGGDAARWRSLFGPLADDWSRLAPSVLGPLVRVPRHPLPMVRFAGPALLPASALARLAFRGPAARALFSGFAAHSMLRLTQWGSTGYGLVTGLLAHAVGWPLARGGSGSIARALAAEARSRGVEIVTGCRVGSLGDLPPARAVVLDLTPRQVLEVAGDRLPGGYRRRLAGFRHGPGVFKVDWALAGAIPWRDPETARAGTVHLGGTLAEVIASEEAPARGRIHARPFTLLVQPTLADPSRAPAGRHVAWAYCHVPNGSTADMTAAIEAQVERFAPGFGDLVLARSTKDSGGDGGLGRELRRRRHQRRHRRPPPARVPAGRAAEPLHDPGPVALPVLVLDATGRRRPRHVRLARGAGGRALAPAGMNGPSTGAGTDRILARSVAAAMIALPLVVAGLVLADPGGVVLMGSYLVPGLVLAVRRPGQPIAWLLVVTAIGLGLGTTRVTAGHAELVAGVASPLEQVAAWANGNGWAFVFAGLTGIALVFPGGSLPGGRSGVLARALVVAFAVDAVLVLCGPIVNVTLHTHPYGVDVPNPFALPVLADSAALVAANGVLWAAMFGITILASMSLLVRFRRSTGLERLQYRWLAWAIVVVALASALWALVRNVLQVELVSVANLIVLVAYPAIPVAVVVAVLRYRLYEIDRLVSRTLGWGLATAAVLAVFAVLVLALQALLAQLFTQGQTLAVAASTIVASAAFQPVRARVQAVVDARFDRPRLEAERSLGAFGERLQHEVDLPTLVREVEATVGNTLRPTAAGLWIRPS